jgi:type IV pilus assembly protein PilE
MDLVAALAIAALLACIAVPSYRDHLARVHRSDARAALLALAVAEENFHATCNAYASTLDDSQESSCGASSLKFPASVAQGSYALELSSPDADHWAAAATAVRGSTQERDVHCRVLRITSTGRRAASRADGAANDEECWRR